VPRRVAAMDAPWGVCADEHQVLSPSRGRPDLEAASRVPSVAVNVVARRELPRGGDGAPGFAAQPPAAAKAWFGAALAGR
jgi:hypothetical protein